MRIETTEHVPSAVVTSAEVIQPSTQRQRFVPLDGLRALAFGSVFFYHAFNLPFLWCGVDMFFVLSGYLITSILLRTSGRPGYFSAFYRHRTFRIFPAYYASIGLAVLLLGSSLSSVLPWALTYSVNFHRAFYNQDTALTPLWSLAVEEQFYLLWPLALYLCPATRRRRLLLILAIAAPICRLLTHIFISRTGAGTLLPCRMDGLVGGAFIAYLASRGELQRWVRPALLALVPAGILFVGTAAAIPQSSVAYSLLVYECSAAFFTLLVVVVVGEAMPRLNRALSWRPLVYSGTISYGLYLIHLPLIFFFRRHFDSKPVVATLALASTFILAALSWRFFEGPLNRRRDIWLRHSRISRASSTSEIRLG